MRILVRDITFAFFHQAGDRGTNSPRSRLRWNMSSDWKENRRRQNVSVFRRKEGRGQQDLNASLTENILKEKGIQATLELASSPNNKVVVIGNSDRLPIILNDQVRKEDETYCILGLLPFHAAGSCAAIESPVPVQ